MEVSAAVLSLFSFGNPGNMPSRPAADPSRRLLWKAPSAAAEA